MADNEEHFENEEGAEFVGGEPYEEAPEYEAGQEYQEGQPYEGEQPYDDGQQYEGGEQQYDEGQQYDGQQFETAQEEGMEQTEEPSQEEAKDEAEPKYEEQRTETAEESHDQTSGNASKNDDDERKIFVGGLSWETTSKDLREYFEKFGKVVDCTLKTDPSTGRSRGFGFVLFDSTSTVDKVIAEKNHVLHNKNIDPKRAMVRGGRIDACKKVFVGGVNPDVPESEIREYFGKFGKIEEVELPFDRVKNQRRAYVFISYESEEVVERVIANPKQTFSGKEVDVRKATPRSDQDGFGGRGGRGGQRGRGHGGYPGQTGGYYQDGSAAAPVAPAYDYSSYYNYPQGYGAGYAYPGYAYPGYDYSSYYGQAADWSSYQQGYAQSYPGGYYDYSNWYGQDQNTQNAAAGKAKRGSSGTSYHPYSR